MFITCSAFICKLLHLNIYGLRLVERGTLMRRHCFRRISSLFCFSGRIPRLSLIQHTLYIGVVEKSLPPPPPTGEQYRKMEPKYPEDGHCQSALRHLMSPFGIFNKETTAPFNDVVSREMNLWKSFDLLLGSNL